MIQSKRIRQKKSGWGNPYVEKLGEEEKGKKKKSQRERVGGGKEK